MSVKPWSKLLQTCRPCKCGSTMLTFGYTHHTWEGGWVRYVRCVKCGIQGQTAWTLNRDEAAVKRMYRDAVINWNKKFRQAKALSAIPERTLLNAVAYCRTQTYVGFSGLQRRCAVGYGKAAKIIEALQERGVLGEHVPRCGFVVCNPEAAESEAKA